MSKKATIIAVVNQKGGTGKTTTTENLGVGLALEGKKVLLVDTDPQASLTVSLGNPCPDDLSPTLSDLMGKIMMENPIAPGEGILHHPEGVDLVPSNIELSGMEVALVNAMSCETILRQYLDTVKQNYDYILLDCMPSLGYGSPVATSKHRRCLEVPTEPTGETADRECVGSCRQCADTGSGSIPSCKGSGTVAWNHQQGQETNQPQTENRRDFSDDGRQPNQLLQGHQQSDSGELRWKAESLQDRYSPFCPCRGSQR